jgi:hypothetical protein
MASIPLTLAELAKAQAEAEGFQNGPQPTLNQANLYTQDCLLNNPQTPGTPQSTTPYYPSAETPNLQLSTRDMASELANNFCILDTVLATSVPIISQRLQLLNATTAQSASLSLTTTQMVTVSMYLSSAGTAGAGHQVIATLHYTCELGPEVISVILPLDARTIIMETYPLLVLGGTTVTLSTAYAGGAVNDPYNLDARLVQMP